MGKIISLQEWVKSKKQKSSFEMHCENQRQAEQASGKYHPEDAVNTKPEYKPVGEAREEFLENVQKLGSPVNILGRMDYERWLNGPDQNTWPTSSTRVCLHAAMKLNGVEDWQVTPLQQEFLIKCTSKLMQEYTPNYLLDNTSLLQEQLMMLFTEEQKANLENMSSYPEGFMNKTESVSGFILPGSGQKKYPSELWPDAGPEEWEQFRRGEEALDAALKRAYPHLFKDE